MLAFGDKKCQSCEEGSEIMGAGEYVNEALIVGGAILFLLFVIYLKK